MSETVGDVEYKTAERNQTPLMAGCCIPLGMDRLRVFLFSCHVFCFLWSGLAGLEPF